MPRDAEDGGESRLTHGHRISELNRNLQEHETTPDGMAPGLYAGERPAAGGTASCRVFGPQQGGEILPPRGPGDVAETGAHGLPTVYGVHEVHPHARDGGGAETAASESGASRGGAGCSCTHRVPGDGRGSGTARNNGAGNDAVRINVARARTHGGRLTSDHLEASERQFLSTILRETSKEALGSDDVSRIFNMCQRVMTMEQFQNLDDDILLENEDCERMIDVLLSNCIESETHPNIRERAVAAVCYFLKMYKDSDMEPKEREQFLRSIIKGLNKYSFSWTFKPSRKSYVSSKFHIALVMLFKIWTFDVNMI